MDLYVTTPDNIEHYIEVGLDDTVGHVYQKVPRDNSGYLTFNGQLLKYSTKLSDIGIESQGRLEWKRTFNINGRAYPSTVGAYLGTILANCDSERVADAVELALDDDKVTIESVFSLKICMDIDRPDLFRMLLAHPRIHVEKHDTGLLHKATYLENDSFLKEILEDGRINPDESLSLINTVCEKGEEDKLQLFIDDGRVVPQLPKTDAIYHAIHRGRLSMIRTLIAAGIDPHEKNILDNVARSGHLSVVKLFVEDYKIDPSEHDSTMIIRACQGSNDILMYLLEDGRADPNSGTNACVRHALSSGSIDLIVTLIRDPRIDIMKLTWLDQDVDTQLPPPEDHVTFAKALVKWFNARRELLEVTRR